MSTLSKIENWAWKYKWSICAYVLLATALLVSIRCCNNRIDDAKRLKQNIEALNDTIHNYTTQNGNYISRISSLVADINELKLYNEELASLVEEYRKATNSKPVTAITAEAELALPEADTVYVLKSVEVLPDMCHPFDFSDKWRLLSGRVWLESNKMGLHVDKEKVYLDLTAGIDDDYNVFVMTDNPYVDVTSLTGFTVPRKKTKRWSLNVSAGMWGGYDIRSRTFGYGPGVMLGVGYNIVSF